MQNAKGDIVQHRLNFNDWEDDWIFYDSRFNLLYGAGDEFLRFLCETVHPIVRPDTDQARRLVDEYNRILAPDACSIVEVQQISGKPVFGPERLGQRKQTFDEPTGWEKVDRQIKAAQDHLRTSDTEEHFQAVGLLCREALITVCQEVYDSQRHGTRNGVVPSSTDVERMLEAFFDSELPGKTNEDARAYSKAALRLTLALQHKRSADFRMAALCVEATVSAVNILALLGNRRNMRI